MRNSLQQRFEAALQACAALRGDCRPLVVAPPVSIGQVEAIEQQLGQRLPSSFRTVLTTFSAHVEVTWFLPNDLEVPDLFRGVFSGDCRLDINRLIELEDGRHGWVEHCFPNPDDPYDRIWHNKFAFQDVGNGDMLAIDLAVDDGPVLYLSHEGDDFHGSLLAHNFIDFIERWSMIGFVGAEEWQLEKFVSSHTSGLEPHGEPARLWRQWFGLQLDASI